MINNIIKNKFKNKKIIITGGTGLIGRQLTKILRNLNAKITVVSLDKYSIEKGVKYIIGGYQTLVFASQSPKTRFCIYLAGTGCKNDY